MADNLGAVSITVEADASGFSRDLEGKVVPQASKAGRKIGDSMGEGVKAGLTVLAGQAFVGLIKGAANTAKSMAGFIGDSIIKASDLNETSTAVNAVFGKATADIEKFASQGVQVLGTTKNEALNAAKTFGIFGKSAGLAGGDLSKFSTDMVGLVGDLASFHNADPSEVIDALGAGLRGEAEPLRRFGILMDDASLKAQAMAMGMKVGNGPLTQQQKVLAAQALILKQTTDAQGDLAKTSGGLANQMRFLSKGWEETKTTIGQAFLPVATAAVTMLNKLLTAAQPLISAIGDRLAPVFEKITAVITGFGSGGGLGKVTSMLGPLAGALTGAGAAVLPLLKRFGPLQGLLAKLPLSFGPIGIGIGALTALATIDPKVLASGLNSVVQAIPGLINGLVNGITGALTGIVSALPGIFSALAANIPTLITGILGGLTSLISSLAAALPSVITSLVTAVTQAIPQIVTAVVGLIPQVIKALVGGIGALIKAGVTLFTGLVKAVATALPQIISALVALVPVLAQTLISLVPVLIQAGMTLFQALISALTTILPLIIAAVINLLPALITTLLGMIPTLVQAAITLFQAIITGLMTAIPLILQMLTTLLPQLLQTLLLMLPMLISAALQLFSGIIQGISQAIPQIISALTELLPQLIQTLIGMIPQLIDTALQLFLQIVVAVTQAIPQIVDGLVALLPELIDTLVAMIPQLISTGITVFLALVDAITQALPQIVAALITILPPLVSALIGMIPQLLQAAIQLFLALVQAIPQIVPQLVAAIPQLISAIVTAIAKGVPALLGAGKDLIGGLIKGIGSMAGELISSIKNTVTDKLPGFVKKALGINSPSKVFAAIGKGIPEGMIVGIQEGQDGLLKAIDKSVKSFTASYKAALDKETKNIKVKMPELSDAEAKKVATKNVAVYARAISDANSAFAKQTRTTAGLWARGMVVGVANLLSSINARTGAFVKNGKVTSATLADIARAAEFVSNKLKDAREKLEDMKKARAELQASVAGNIVGQLDLSGLVGENDQAFQDALSKQTDAIIAERQRQNAEILQWNKTHGSADRLAMLPDLTQEEAAAQAAQQVKKTPVTFKQVAGLISGMRQKAATLNQVMKDLVKAGFPPAMVQMIVGYGVEQAIEIGKALLAGSPLEQKATIADFTAFQGVAQSIGGVVAGQMFDAGIAAQQGLVDGLTKDMSKLQAAAKLIADTIIKETNRRLGIRSPSTVMAKAGAFAGQGFVDGVTSMMGPASRALGALSAAVSPGRLRGTLVAPRPVVGGPGGGPATDAGGAVNVTVSMTDLAQLKDFDSFLAMLRVRSRMGAGGRS